MNRFIYYFIIIFILCSCGKEGKIKRTLDKRPNFDNIIFDK